MRVAAGVEEGATWVTDIVMGYGCVFGRGVHLKMREDRGVITLNKKETTPNWHQLFSHSLWIFMRCLSYVTHNEHFSQEISWWNMRDIGWIWMKWEENYWRQLGVVSFLLRVITPRSSLIFKCTPLPNTHP
jgi:hypothetical protein